MRTGRGRPARFAGIAAAGAFAVATAGGVVASAATKQTLPEQPVALAVAPGGGLYLADVGRQQIIELSPGGRFHAVVGTGVAGLSGDGGPALAARVDDPNSLAIAADGALYFAQAGSAEKRAPGGVVDSVVREVSPAGTVRTVAGMRPNCDAARPSATSITAESAQFDGAALSFEPDGKLAIGTTVCAGDHSLRPLLELSGSRLQLVPDSRLPAPAAVDCGAGVRGHGFTFFSCASGAARTRYAHPAELLVIRSDGGYTGYHDSFSQADPIASAGPGDVVAAHNDAIVRVTASGLVTLVSQRQLTRLVPKVVRVAAINDVAVTASGQIFLLLNYYATDRHGCGNVLAELTSAGELRSRWRSAAGLTCG